MPNDQGPATKDQEPWPWPMAMAGRVAATLRVKYKIDFIFDSQGGRHPFRLKYEIDFVFDSKGGGHPLGHGHWPWRPRAWPFVLGP